jgi:hypothetical protein
LRRCFSPRSTGSLDRAKIEWQYKAFAGSGPSLRQAKQSNRRAPKASLTTSRPHIATDPTRLGQGRRRNVAVVRRLPREKAQNRRARRGPRKNSAARFPVHFRMHFCDKALTMTNPEAYISPLGTPPLAAMTCLEKPLTVCAVNHPASQWPRRMCGLRRLLLRFSRPSRGEGVRERREAKTLG